MDMGAQPSRKGEVIEMAVSDDLRRRMHQEHRTLHILQDDLLDAFDAYCIERTAANQKIVRRMFGDFGDSLRRHFDFEEVGGYMATVVDRRPHHAPEVERMREEHKTLTTQLRQIADQLDSDLEADDAQHARFVADFVKFMALFGRHEQSERELVMEVFWVEGGVSS